MPKGVGAGGPVSGWLVVDPTGAVYAWYGVQVAGDVDAVWKLVGRTAAIRRKYVAAGWAVRRGCWSELFSAGAGLGQVSA